MTNCEGVRSVIAELEHRVEQERERREVSLALKNSMRKIASEYSFQREEGLKQLLKLVHDLLSRGLFYTKPLGDGKEEDVPIAERLLRSVFPKTPPPSIQHRMCCTTASEKRLAMQCLEGLCVLSQREQQAFIDARGVSTVYDELQKHIEDVEKSKADADMVPVLCACLDTLLVSSLNKPAAQHQVIDIEMPLAMHTVLKIDSDMDVCYKIIEFLSVFSRICILNDGMHSGHESSRGPVPPPDCQTPSERLYSAVRTTYGVEIASRLNSCVTLRGPATPASSSMCGKRTTTRERDLRTQGDIIACIKSASSTGYH